MKKLWIFYIALCAVGWVHADTTIDPSHPYAYAANTGWLNARGDVTNGAGSLSGYAYGANIGWVTFEQTRFYELQQATALTGTAAWTDSGLGQMPPDPGLSMTREVIDPSATTRFYRVQASIPLSE